MRKRDELTDPNSCMSRAKDDEWTFVLLGRDAAAPATVRFWVSERLRMKKNREDDPQIVEALAWCEAVDREAGRLMYCPKGHPIRVVASDQKRGACNHDDCYDDTPGAKHFTRYELARCYATPEAAAAKEN
jgi:hypothetical protein